MLSGFTRLPSKSKTWSQRKRSSVSRRLLKVLMLSGSFSYQLFENYFACRLCCFRATRLHAARQGVRGTVRDAARDAAHAVAYDAAREAARGGL